MTRVRVTNRTIVETDDLISAAPDLYAACEMGANVTGSIDGWISGPNLMRMTAKIVHSYSTDLANALLEKADRMEQAMLKALGKE